MEEPKQQWQDRKEEEETQEAEEAEEEDEAEGRWQQKEAATRR